MMSLTMCCMTGHEHQIILFKPKFVFIMELGALIMEQVKIQIEIFMGSRVSVFVMRGSVVLVMSWCFHQLVVLVGVDEEHGEEEYDMGHVMALSHLDAIQRF